MKKYRLALMLLSLAAVSAGLTIFLTFYAQASSFTILSHRYTFRPLYFGYMGLIFLAAAAVWLFLSRIDIKYFNVPPSRSLWENLIPFWSFLPFLFTPFLTGFYLSRQDLHKRLLIFLALSALCFLYLKFIQLNRYGYGNVSIQKGLMSFARLPQKKKGLILFLSAFLIYLGCTYLLVQQGITFSGDEPYYLLTTHSLYQDQDINVANNYANQDYFHYYSREQNPKLKLGMYARAGRRGRDYIYPINLSGLSFLLLPFYWLSQFFGGKILTFILKGSLSFGGALLGLQVYLLSKDLWDKEKLSLLLWGMFSFTSPVLFYSIHLYPEIIIAVVSVYVFRKILLSNSLSSLQTVFLGFLLSLFTWFGLKYNLIFWPLFLIALYFLWKKGRSRIHILYFIAFPLLSVILFYVYLYELYGSFYPFSIYEGVMTAERVKAFKEMIFKIPVLLRLDTFLDYFLDQRDGLFLYSPVYFFSLLGLVEVFRRSKKIFISLFLISFPFIFNYAFLSHRQGYCPQGRVLAPLSWVGAVLIGYFLACNKKPLYSFLFRFSFCASVFFTVLLLCHPLFLYQPTTHEVTFRAGDLFVYLSNMYVFIPKFLPSFIKVDNLSYLPNYVWLLLILLFTGGYILIRSQRAVRLSFKVLAAFILILVVFFLWVVFPQPPLYPTRTFHYSRQKAMGFYLFPMGQGVVVKKMSEFYLHREGSFTYLFTSRTALEEIRLRYGSTKGEYKVELSFFDLPVYEGFTAFERKDKSLVPPAFYRFKKLYLYLIKLNIDKISEESMIVHPYFLQILPK